MLKNISLAVKTEPFIQIIFIFGTKNTNGAKPVRFYTEEILIIMCEKHNTRTYQL